VAREYEIDPEPEPDTVAAIVEAIERLAGENGWDEAPGGASSRWRAHARRESVEDGLD
jgi:hypothetical protein